MGFIASLTAQLGELIRSQTAARKLALLIIVVGSIGAMVALILRATWPAR